MTIDTAVKMVHAGMNHHIVHVLIHVQMVRRDVRTEHALLMKVNALIMMLVVLIKRVLNAVIQVYVYQMKKNVKRLIWSSRVQTVVQRQRR